MQGEGTVLALWSCRSHRSAMSSKSQCLPVGKRLLTGGITLNKSSFSATHLLLKLRMQSLTYDCEASVTRERRVIF